MNMFQNVIIQLQLEKEIISFGWVCTYNYFPGEPACLAPAIEDNFI